MVVRVESGHEAHVRGEGARRGHDAVIEDHALAGEAIEHRGGLEAFVAVQVQVVRPKRVEGEEEDRLGDLPTRFGVAACAGRQGHEDWRGVESPAPPGLPSNYVALRRSAVRTPVEPPEGSDTRALRDHCSSPVSSSRILTRAVCVLCAQPAYVSGQ